MNKEVITTGKTVDEAVAAAVAELGVASADHIEYTVIDEPKKGIFGIGAVKNVEKIDFIINLELWQDKKQYDRLGLTTEYTDILGIDIPSITVPVKPGRNLAVVIEVAAMNNRQKKMGYNAAEALNNRVMSGMTQNLEDEE